MTWRYLFDSDYAQRRDIDAAREQSAAVAIEVQNTELALRRALAAASTRVARLELALEALIRVLEERGQPLRADVALMVQRIDLSDGVEDGVMGPNRAMQAPPCASCGLPLNPARDRCIYCDAAAPVRAAAPASIMVRCSRCRQQIEKRDSLISAAGVVCQACFEVVGAG